jgi:hypothetical protein
MVPKKRLSDDQLELLKEVAAIHYDRGGISESNYLSSISMLTMVNNELLERILDKLDEMNKPGTGGRNA